MVSGGGMEVEVRVVGGARSCFVALPLHLIEALSRTSASGDLPPVLALDLRAAAGARWSLAWSGAASRSRAIEVAQELAECISLPDGTIAQLSVARSLTRADSVSIEPFSEDDWEILESRADLAEETILQQVGIVYEGMKFPLWLDGHNIVKFVVVSSSPKKSVVQLVPGTEVAVAPKKRKEKFQDVQKQGSLKEQVETKALLRVQAADRKYAHKFKSKGIELGVVLSYAVLIHPDTAARTSFDSVAKGHVMLPYSIRHFISADTHSWVYVTKYTANVKKDEPIMKMCPLHFSMHEKYVHDNSDLGGHEKDTWRNTSIPSENSNFFQKAPNNEHLLSADADSISESMSEQKVGWRMQCRM
uniref:Peroxisomal ATPase PEX1 N-terminal C-lobe domain-containing protein n=1 Tax=Triticum urartu TaxID=4572 RepID=A0A8R7R1D4_TRIUA